MFWVVRQRQRSKTGVPVTFDQSNWFNSGKGLIITTNSAISKQPFPDSAYLTLWPKTCRAAAIASGSQTTTLRPAITNHRAKSIPKALSIFGVPTLYASPSILTRVPFLVKSKICCRINLAYHALYKSIVLGNMLPKPKLSINAASARLSRGQQGPP
ncbi:MAG: hypothetical protein UV04_C0007G0010 [Candidatus Gottesmanbacteria bacterium GW2011_GWA2_42_16]|nr:MAG: hypothetical protein UV04_C0007G0010 [Candidatus Gottesmanbacteria bacterium GW2011_GWA2_42_16]